MVVPREKFVEMPVVGLSTTLPEIVPEPPWIFAMPTDCPSPCTLLTVLSANVNVPNVVLA